MYKAQHSSQFKKDALNCMRQGLDLNLLEQAMTFLESGDPLPEEYNDHPLKGEYKKYRECHINGRFSDWVVIYYKHTGKMLIVYVRTGSHSKLYKK